MRETRALRLALGAKLRDQDAVEAAERIEACGETATTIGCPQHYRTKLYFLNYCGRRTCPTCAPRGARRLRKILGRRIRYVVGTQARRGHALMLVTPAIKTIPAVLRRQSRDSKGRPYSAFARWATDRARMYLAKLYPGEPVGEKDGSRRRRPRRGAGGAFFIELGAKLGLHWHAIAYGLFYPPEVRWALWRKLSAYRACLQCGSFHGGRRVALCPDSACPLYGKPMELVESTVVDTKMIRGGVSVALNYVSKYISKPADGELEQLALFEWLIQSMKRMRTWGSFQGISETELTEAGFPDEKAEPLCCEECGEKMRTEDSGRGIPIASVLGIYESAEAYRRRRRRLAQPGPA